MSKRLSVLISLAKTDGTIDDKEMALIMRIGHAHGFSDVQIADFIEKSDPADVDFDILNPEEKFETLYDLVHLMKVDGRVFDEEIFFCMNMARKLGYPMEAVMDLYGLVHANVKLTSEIQKIKHKYH